MAKIRLQFFAEGGAEGAPATTGAETATQAEVKTSGSSRRTRGNKGELADVVYGKTETTEATGTGSVAESKADVSTTSNTLEARRQAFEELIGGEYKDLFTERTQNIIDRRFKETKNLEAQVNSAKPILDTLFQKYKITDGNLDNLAKAIEADDTYWEEAAEEAGLTVPQYKEIQRIQRENEELRKAQQQINGERQVNAQMNEWYRQADELKAIYPSFDLRVESQNRDFIGLLKAGISVQKAYETIHLDELVTGAASVAARQAEQRTVESIKSRASRPTENGTSSQASATIKSDVSSLTRADREEIARRVARGEIIKF